MMWVDPDENHGQVAVNVPDQDRLLSDLADHFRDKRGFSVATINLDHAVKLRRDPQFRQAYAAQTHVTADGHPIVWLSRLAGQTDIALVPGSEVVEPVAQLAATHDVPVALVGSTEASLARAKAVLEAKYPGLRIVMTYAPAMGFEADGAEAGQIIEDLRASGARLVYLALGAPRQERFAARAQAELPETGFLSIGAGLDFISGLQARAPGWVQAIAGEWLWRLVQNPKRLAPRYAACLAILPSLFLKAVRTQRR